MQNNSCSCKPNIFHTPADLINQQDEYRYQCCYDDDLFFLLSVFSFLVFCYLNCISYNSRSIINTHIRLSAFSDCISSIRVIPNASTRVSNVLISGNPSPLSHRLTALSVTLIFSASSDCVICLSCFRNIHPEFFASITHLLPLQ